MATYLGLGNPLVRNTMRLGDALHLAQEGKITLQKSSSPFSLWSLAKNVNSGDRLVSSFAKACAGIFANLPIKMVSKPLSERNVSGVQAAGRGHVHFDNSKGTVTKDDLNSEEMKFLAEIHDNPSHPLRPFVPDVKGLDRKNSTVTMENTSVGVRDRDNDVLDIKIGKRITNKEELLKHDYQGKSKLALGYKMFRMGELEKLTGARTRGYTFIPQTKNKLDRIGQGKNSETQILGRLAGRPTKDVESVLKQLQGMKAALEKDNKNAFVATSVLITFPEGKKPEVKLIDFAHRMTQEDFSSGINKKSFEQARNDFIDGIDNLAKLVGGEVVRRQDEFRQANAQLVDSLLDHDKVLTNGMRQDFVDLFFVSEKHAFGIEGKFSELPPGDQAKLRKYVAMELDLTVGSGMPLDEKAVIDAIKTAVRQGLAIRSVSGEMPEAIALSRQPNAIQVALRDLGILPPLQMPSPNARMPLTNEQQQKVEFLTSFAKGDYVKDFHELQEWKKKGGVAHPFENLSNDAEHQLRVRVKAQMEELGFPTEDRVAKFFAEDRGTYGFGPGLRSLEDLPKDTVVQLRARVKAGLEDLVRDLSPEAFDKEAPVSMRVFISEFMNEIRARDRQYDVAFQNGGTVPRYEGTQVNLSKSEVTKITDWVTQRVDKKPYTGVRFNDALQTLIPNDLRDVVAHIDEAFIKDLSRQNYVVGHQAQRQDNPAGSLRAFAELFRGKDGQIDFKTLSTVSSILNQNGDGCIVSSPEFLKVVGPFAINTPVGFKRYSVEKDPGSNGVVLKIESQGKPLMDREGRIVKDIHVSNNFVDYTLAIKVTPPARNGASCGVQVLSANFRARLD